MPIGGLFGRTWYNECMNSDLLSRITIEPGKCGGRPCIRGERIRVTSFAATVCYRIDVYTVQIVSSAKKDVRRLDGSVRRRVLAAFHALESNPRPHGCKKLVDETISGDFALATIA